MVQIITTYPGRAPEEVERQVTIPIEQVMGNVPRVEVMSTTSILRICSAPSVPRFHTSSLPSVAATGSLDLQVTPCVN